MAVQLPGSFERTALEHTLSELIRTHGLVRLKGRLWLAGKALPLQIQAAGPRLECWFEGIAGATGAPGLELVLMGFGLDRQAIESRLAFLKFATMHFISAKKRQGLGPLWQAIGQAHQAAMIKLPTPMLTRLLLEAVQFQAPKRAGMFRPKLRYAHQGGMNPPVIVVHGNSLEHVTDAYKRYLEGRFRKAFKLEGTPLRIEMRTAHNPYKDKDD